jgi:hypothetical protein
MKHLFLLLALSPLVVHAQNISLQEAGEYADSLIKKEILKEKGRARLLKEIGGKSLEVENRFAYDVTGTVFTNNKPSKSAILTFCARIFYEAMLHRMTHKTDVEQKIVAKDSLIISKVSLNLSGNLKDGEDLVHPNRSTIGFTRTQTLQDFKETGLIDSMVYEDCKKALRDQTVKNEAELVAMMAERSVYYSYYEFNLAKQQEYINQLAAAGILPQEGKISLLRSYQPYELKTVPQILAFSHRFLPVDLDSMPADPHVIYPVVFRAIQELVPEFKYDALQVSMREEKESDLVRQDVTLSFKADSNTYTHTFFHDFLKEAPGGADTAELPTKIDLDFHKGVNKWLTDRESNYRLHIIIIPGNGRTFLNAARVGLVMLREEEADLVSKDPYVISRESFDPRLSRKHISMLLQDLCAQGLLGDMEQAQVDSVKNRIYASDIRSVTDVFDSIHHVIVPVTWEAGDLKAPYKELTLQLVRASGGAFTVGNITDEFGKGSKDIKKIKYGFTLHKKRYDTMLEFKDDWLDPHFLDLVKKALKENKVNGDIYYCRSGEGLIFLSPAQHAFISENYPEVFGEE